MRKLKLAFLGAMIIGSGFMVSCNKEEVVVTPEATKVEQNENLTLKGMNLDIDFSKGVFSLDKGINFLATDIADYIYDNSISKEERNNIFNIKFSEGQAFINSNPTNNQTSRLEPCGNRKKVTCRSKQCVQDTLIDILGDGSRDVEINYVRNTLSVTIYYEYQDC